MAVLAQAVTDYAAVLEQLEIVTAERDAAVAALSDLFELVDRGAYLTADRQQVVRRARALLVEHGRLVDTHEVAVAQWALREETR